MLNNADVISPIPAKTIISKNAHPQEKKARGYEVKYLLS